MLQNMLKMLKPLYRLETFVEENFKMFKTTVHCWKASVDGDLENFQKLLYICWKAFVDGNFCTRRWKLLLMVTSVPGAGNFC